MRSSAVTYTVGITLVLALCAAVSAGEPEVASKPLVLIEDGPIVESVLYDGSVVDVQLGTTTTYISGSNIEGFTIEDLKRDKATIDAAIATSTATKTISADGPRGSLNVFFVVSGTIPAAAEDALEEVASYVEGQFQDDVEIGIQFSMTSLPAGVLGQANSSHVNDVNWPVARISLINDMDADDVIEQYLPLVQEPGGLTKYVPVRYNASFSTISYVDSVTITVANYRAGIGTAGGFAASIALNTEYSWDYDPSDGVTFNKHCFQSVLAHELAHCMGFVSSVDSGADFLRLLDVYRFQRTDGTGDYNPDSYSEFETTARTIDFNNLDDDVVSDIIDFEYRMEDGSPNQASHFREQTPMIGIMDPQSAPGETTWPDFYLDPDLNMLDALGWDYTGSLDESPPSPSPMTFSTLPVATSNSAIEMAATPASDETPPVTYEFELVSGGAGGDSRDWDTSRFYTDDGLSPSTAYSYRVRARDSVSPDPYVTEFSDTVTVYTFANRPDRPTFSDITAGSVLVDILPAGNSAEAEYAVQCTGGSPADPNWQMKYVDADGNPSATAVWLTKEVWESTPMRGLINEQTYYARTIARNGDGIETLYSLTGIFATLAPGDGDMDSDGDWDLDDYVELMACFGGSSAASGCLEADITGDGMVTLDDCAEFIDVMTGP